MNSTFFNIGNWERKYMRKIKVAATQMSCTWDIGNNIKKAEGLVRKAAQEGANVILIKELFETPYFCQQQSEQNRFYRLTLCIIGEMLCVVMRQQI